MRAEWGVSLHDALFVESLPATIVLWPALAARHGAETQEPKHVEQARLEAKERARKWIAANYEIIPTPGGGRRRRNSRPLPRRAAPRADGEGPDTDLQTDHTM